MSQANQYQGPRLLVPIAMDALVITQPFRQQESWYRDQIAYSQLKKYNAVHQTITELTDTEDILTGVNVQWLLPKYLTHGTEKDNALEFPLVPNRWLVFRLYPKADKTIALKGWLLLNDYLGEDEEQGSSFVLKENEEIKSARIGKVFEIEDLDISLLEQENQKNLFLSVIGPGEPTFAGFTVDNDNVFSFNDPMTGLGNQELELTYMVAGWYSKPNKDFLETDRSSFKNLNEYYTWLRGLELKAGDVEQIQQAIEKYKQWWRDNNFEGDPDQQDLYATQVLCHSSLSKVKWTGTTGQSQSGRPGKIDRSKPETIPDIVIGNTGFDALIAFIRKEYSKVAPGKAEKVIKLLEALNFDLMELLDNPNSDFLIERSIHNAWFDGITGYTQWRIAKESKKSIRLNAQQKATFQALQQSQLVLLDRLNEEQLTLDKSKINLEQLKKEAYNLWYKGKKLRRRRPQMDKEELKRLQAANAQAIIAKEGAIVTETGIVEATKKEIEALFDKSKPYTKDQYALQSLTTDNFWLPKSPVLFIHAAGRGNKYLPKGVIPCRYSGLTLNQDTPIPTIPHTKQFPKEIPDLLREVLAGSVIDYDASKRWAPLFLNWKVQYQAGKITTPALNDWELKPTIYDYTVKGEHEKPYTLTFEGRTLLGDRNTDALIQQIEQFAEGEDENVKKELEALCEFLKGWDIVAQRLSGFHERLMMQDINNIIPIDDADLGKSLKGVPFSTPIMRTLSQQIPFHPIRKGIFTVEYLNIVDDFGLAFEPIGPSDDPIRHVPIKAKGLDTSTPNDPYLQLPPRVLQPARLKFDWVDSTTNTKLVNSNPASTPVIGWVVPNYSDKGLFIFDALGQALGKILMAKTDNGEKAKWYPTPGTKPGDTYFIKTANDIPNQHLKDFAIGIINHPNSKAALSEFTETIDKSLWTIAPVTTIEEQKLSLYIGRPLALVRAELQLELLGNPLFDQLWKETGKNNTHGFPSLPFSIRIGEEKHYMNGLVGYFEDTDYSQFKSLFPTENKNYVKARSPMTLNFQKTTKKTVSLLIEPNEKIQVTTGILPTYTKYLPTKYTNQAIEKMDITVRVGPLISQPLTAKPDPKDPTKTKMPTIRMPKPLDMTGKLTWLYRSGVNAWVETENIEMASQDAQLSEIRPQIYEGWLKFSDLLKKGER